MGSAFIKPGRGFGPHFHRAMIGPIRGLRARGAECLMTLDINPLEKAIARFEEGLARYHRDITDTQIRDGLIRRFEFAYELGHKTLKRYLDFVAPSPGAYDEMAFADMIRSAIEQSLLLGDWPAWRRYREMRGKTSHAYAEKTALEVVGGLADFLAEIRFLRDELKRRLA
jgi:nucleotidyltransferase substrate binding protein (TIGR01987 family)